MKYLFVFLLVGMSISAFGQSKYAIHIDQSCSFDIDLIDTTVYSFASDAQADKALNRIMKLTGLPANFELKSASVPNACAVVKCDDYGDCKRYILYSQEFMENIKDETRTNYAELGVLAHEIGHHLSGHTLTKTGSRYDSELEADKFAGFILFKLGATITEVKQCYSNLSSAGSSSHPPKSARIAAVSSGYYDAKRDGSSNESITSSNTKKGIIKIGQLEVMTKVLGRMDWDAAKRACASLGNGWRLPTKYELNILYKNRDKIGPSPVYFNEGGHRVDCYWSSSVASSHKHAYMMDFKDGGIQYNFFKFLKYFVRPVRTVE